MNSILFFYFQDSSPTGGHNEFDGLTSTPNTNRLNTTDHHSMKNVIETKNLQHTIQLLKIELNQRDLYIQNQKIQHEEKCDDLQEKLADMTYQRQLLQTKLDSQFQVKQNKSKIFRNYFLFPFRLKEN